MLLLLGTVAAVIVLVVILTSRPHTIDLEQFVKVDFVGENTQGRAERL